ncbi:MAG TPA: branched-chain amino acid ABC transporter substrate-binding protein [Actinophytocola sp.]|uniref:branched-chain amino acid ABC transporter substrate-binding protein n=1 Tax=Actinophytocola sp. TaxID=1872138 RepID=UPI002DDDB65B|nr:branched-chain amino acid ABC transporter substrate-binding protein [Actinophytocola sp.]HEV2780153.1 branched-chain amino acid ABC transporter substrate-binding protein [Actinophytocola sp.]
MGTLRPKIARLGGVLAAGMALTLTLAACAGSSNNNSGGGGGGGGGATTIKIGFMGDLTGENSAIVIPPRNGAKLAIEEYNAKNPQVKIELVEYDSQGKPEQATSLVQKAIGQDKIVGLIGPAFSGESKAVGAQLEEGKIPSVSPSATNPGLAQNGWKYWHRVVANDADQGPGIANFLIKAKSPKTAFVISDDQEYSVGIADTVNQTFTSKGVTTQTDKFSQNASDYSSTVGKVKAANPDVIFYGGYYAQLGKLLKQLRDGGVTAPVASGDGSLDNQLVTAAGKPAAEGAVVGCPCSIPGSDATGELKSFFDKYKAKYNVDPAIYSTEGYDAATVFIKAAEAGKTDGTAINDFIKTVSFEGISKPVKFKDNGEPEANAIFIYQVKNGAVKLLGPAEEAKLEG